MSRGNVRRISTRVNDDTERRAAYETWLQSGLVLPCTPYDAFCAGYVARQAKLGIDPKLVSRMRNGEKPIQLGDLYLVHRSVALHVLDAIRSDIASGPVASDAVEAELLAAMGALGGAVQAVQAAAGAMADGSVDSHEIRPLVQALTEAQRRLSASLDALSVTQLRACIYALKMRMRNYVRVLSDQANGATG